MFASTRNLALYIVLLSGTLTTTAFAQPLVVAVNSPLAYFAKRLGGHAVQVTMPAPEGEDPAFWAPSGDDIAAIQKADLVLLNGAGYAAWVPQASLRRSRLVDTSAKAKDRYLSGDAEVHSHGGQAHEHGVYASNTWLDFEIASLQAEAIAKAFKRKLKLDVGQVDAALAQLKDELAELDALGTIAGEGLKGTAVVGSHPVYHYLAAAYGIDMRFIHWEAAETITPGNEAALAALQAERPADLMLFEFPPSTSAEQAAERAGLRYRVLDPMVNTDADFIDGMRNALMALKP